MISSVKSCILINTLKALWKLKKTNIVLSSGLWFYFIGRDVTHNEITSTLIYLCFAFHLKDHAETMFLWSPSNHVGALTGKAVQSESGRPRPQENAQTCGGAVLQRHGCPHHHNWQVNTSPLWFSTPDCEVRKWTLFPLFPSFVLPAAHWDSRTRTMPCTCSLFFTMSLGWVQSIFLLSCVSRGASEQWKKSIKSNKIYLNSVIYVHMAGDTAQ